ncbi:MAG TPA: GntR family transcriptional regulator, partial [Chloroflexi bacterium]|nr:GntR family transcriptional regulator [Chloroflexota bacterium]
MPIPSDLVIDKATEPAREAILRHLRQLIVDGALQPGEIIRDGEIAEHFGVSRTPVREALLQLRFEGLVIMKPKGWTQVKPLDRSQIEDLFRVIVELEMLAARLAAEKTDADTTTAEEINSRLEALLDEPHSPD